MKLEMLNATHRAINSTLGRMVQRRGRSKFESVSLERTNALRVVM
jgi:hypothetical protein